MEMPSWRPAQRKPELGAALAKGLLVFALALFAVLTLFPMLWLGYSSLKPQLEIVKDPLALPAAPTLDNYANAWTKGELGKFFLNSVLYTVATSSAAAVLGMMASFAFVKIKYRISRILKGSFLIGIFITLQSILIPIFLFESKVVRISDTHLGVLIPYIGVSLPLAVYLGTSFIQAMPGSIIESAKMDGAGYMRTFWSIVFPMAQPVVTTIIVMTGLSIWNEFMMVFVLSKDDAVRSLPVGIYRFSGPLATEYGMQFAALIIGLLPMLAFYLVFRTKITNGFVAGAIKE
jgi:raffinose/stachyose/melibiose transport system permease protein